MSSSSSSPTETAQAQTYLEYRRVQGKLRELKAELKSTPFWKVIQEEDMMRKVSKGRVKKPNMKKKKTTTASKK